MGAGASPVLAGNTVILQCDQDEGTNSFIAAFDKKTGKEVWRFWTIPEPGQPGSESWTGPAWQKGGGPIWTTGTYDPDLNLMYWGVGNPGPDWNGDGRPGDNLYTDSVIALDPDTGKLKWHYQYTPHDEFDYDATQVPVLADIQFNGANRKVLMQANRNGVFYVIDRTNGQFLLAKPFTHVLRDDARHDVEHAGPRRKWHDIADRTAGPGLGAADARGGGEQDACQGAAAADASHGRTLTCRH